MTEHEATALAALDLRMRQAAEDLHQAVDEAAKGWAVDVSTMSTRDGAGDMDGTTDKAGTEDGGDNMPNDELVPVAEDPVSGHRLWQAAAALVAVVGVAAALLVVRGEDRSDPDGGEDESGVVADGGAEQGYLVPDWLPDGWVPLHTELGPGAAGQGPGGAVTAYGDTSLDDPWGGPVLAGYDVLPDTLGSDGQTDEITVGGRPATINLYGDQITVTIEDDGRSVGVIGYGLLSAVGEEQAREVVLTASEHLDGSSAIAAEGLPDGYEQIATGPQAAAGSPGGRGQAAGLLFSYGTLVGEGQPGISVWQQAADNPQAAELLRLRAFDVVEDGPAADVADMIVEVIEVGGQPAYRWRTSYGPDESAGFAVIQWYEPELGLIVTARGDFVDLPTIEQFVDGLHRAGEGEVDELLDGYGTVVDQGEHQGRTWGLAVTDGGELGEITFSVGSAEEVLEIRDPGSAPDPGGSVRGSLPLGGEHGDVAVFGAVDPAAAEVILRSPDDQTFDLEVYEVDGWEKDVFLGFVPVDLVSWPDSVEVVAHGADGRALPGWPVDVGLDDF